MHVNEKSFVYQGKTFLISRIRKMPCAARKTCFPKIRQMACAETIKFCFFVCKNCRYGMCWKKNIFSFKNTYNAICWKQTNILKMKNMACAENTNFLFLRMRMMACADFLFFYGYEKWYELNKEKAIKTQKYGMRCKKKYF